MIRHLLLGAEISTALAFCPTAAVAQAVYATPYTFTTLPTKTPAENVGAKNNGALFAHARSLTVDAGGNLYIANTLSHTICRMTPAGEVTVFAGQAGSSGSVDGIGGAARFRYPQSVALDGAGNIYVADSGNNTIRRITPAGVVTTLAGKASKSGSEDGQGSCARFNYPNGVALDSFGNIYIADLYNALIRKVTPDGRVTTLAGKAECDGSADGKGSNARFNFPVSVAVGDSGNIYVADIINNAIRKVTPTGVVTTLAGHLTYDVGSTDGTGAAAKFYHPMGLVVDHAENIYVTDTANNTVRRITPAGAVTTVAGLAGRSGNTDGTGDAVRFNHPMGIALDNAGNLYVGDLSNGTIRKGVPANPSAISIRRPAGGLSFINP